ncbi:hypothetical protein Acsp06_21600 [Actinomycetospora sp. NBRC 106375]|uniref:hypothetical protein n=1 Tax=Actinomycetospora sp. NBRC 106375 TaxID=3032207 RepID=UPI0024A2E882|nr:hypothetical protein [Actinomycetospora sp. NBRC 106375]GLZ45975.1 hypothetical protein Acsp06_21600 [Actinomycetospora sp. NBRC 106375]
MSSLTAAPPVPRPVRAAVVVWLLAVGAGVAETLVHLALPDPPGPGALVKRALVYAGVVALVLALPSGRNVVRWTLAVLLGVVGTASLVVEPITWLSTGASPVEYLAGAGGAEIAVVVLRTAHLAAVVVALVLMFRPTANAFFRRPT